MDDTILPARLQAVLDEDLPLARFMGLRVRAWTEEGLLLSAPEAPNQNAHGTAFGGSVAALALLAGWGLVWLGLREAGIEPDVVVQKTQARYDRPIQGDLQARAHRPDPASWARFLHTLERRGLARIAVSLEVAGEGAGGGTAGHPASATMTAWYVARRSR